MLKKPSDQKSRLLPTKKPVMPTCLDANTYLSTSRPYIITTSIDDIFMINLKSYINSNQSSVTVLSVPPAFPQTTAVRNKVISKSVICRDSVTECPRKYLRKSTIAKNLKVVNPVSETFNNVVNCSCSTSIRFSAFISI